MFMQRSVVGLVVAVVVAGAGACAEEAKPDVDEDFADLAEADQKSDFFSYRLQLLGPLVDDETRSARYSKTPRFRGYELTARAGDLVDVWVRSTHGDALAWLLDGRFRVIAKNDDADDTTYDAHLTATLPASGTADDRYYVVFRDYNVETHYFKTSLSHTPAGPAGAAWEAVAKTKIEELALAYAPLEAFATPLDELPAIAAERYAALHAVLEQPKTFRVPVDGRPVFVLFTSDGSGEGSPVVVDLIDGAGRWFAHGVGFQFWDGGGGLGWSLNDADPTMCPCVSPGAPATCTWMDGTTSTSTSIVCE